MFKKLSLMIFLTFFSWLVPLGMGADPVAALSLEYQRVYNHKTADQSESHCLIILKNRSEQTLYNVTLQVRPSENAQIDRSTFFFEEILPNQKAESAELFVFSFKLSEEPPNFIWEVEYNDAGGQQQQQRIP